MTFARQHILGAAAAFTALVVGAAGCMSSPVKEVRPDGILHFTCKSKLEDCLPYVEAACDRNRYVVLRAFDDHEYTKLNMWGTQKGLEVRKSEVFVRCGSENAWSPQDIKLRKDPLARSDAESCPAPELAPAAAPARACVPGASQACVGSGGCQGGQVCLPDASALGPCDCGGAKTE